MYYIGYGLKTLYSIYTVYTVYIRFNNIFKYCIMCS